MDSLFAEQEKSYKMSPQKESCLQNSCIKKKEASLCPQPTLKSTLLSNRHQNCVLIVIKLCTRCLLNALYTSDDWS